MDYGYYRFEVCSEDHIDFRNLLRFLLFHDNGFYRWTSFAEVRSRDSRKDQTGNQARIHPQKKVLYFS